MPVLEKFLCKSCNKKHELTEFYRTGEYGKHYRKICKKCIAKKRKQSYKPKEIIKKIAILHKHDNALIDKLDNFLSKNGINFLAIMKQNNKQKGWIK